MKDLIKSAHARLFSDDVVLRTTEIKHQALPYRRSVRRSVTPEVRPEAHLGSRPAQQGEGELADGRNHQVHPHGSPRSLGGLCCSGQLEDGQTSLKAVHVGWGATRTIFGLQVGIPGSFLIQNETLERRKRK